MHAPLFSHEHCSSFVSCGSLSHLSLSLSLSLFASVHTHLSTKLQRKNKVSAGNDCAPNSVQTCMTGHHVLHTTLVSHFFNGDYSKRYELGGDTFAVPSAACVSVPVPGCSLWSHFGFFEQTRCSSHSRSHTLSLSFVRGCSLFALWRFAPTRCSFSRSLSFTRTLSLARCHSHALSLSLAHCVCVCVYFFQGCARSTSLAHCVCVCVCVYFFSRLCATHISCTNLNVALSRSLSHTHTQTQTHSFALPVRARSCEHRAV